MEKFIGIDIGGTKIEGVLLLNDKVLKFSRRLTEVYSNKKNIIENISKVIGEVYDPNARAIGLGIPGRVDANGIIRFIPNIRSLLNFNIKKYLENKFKLKVIVENDAVCFTIAEHLKGAAKNYSNVVGLIIGTGIGAGIIINNNIYKGRDNSAGEVGHNLILVNNELKEFESLCSGYNMALNYIKQHKSRVIFPGDILKGEDKISRKVSKEMYRYLTVNLANLINTLNPDVIVVGGAVSNSLDYDYINREVSKLVISNLTKHVRIIKNKLGDDAGVLGAAYLARN